MIRFPNAKINLGLNIIRRRPDGYHDIATVFYPVRGLTDVLEIVPADEGRDSLTCHGRPVDCPPEKNLVSKACRAMRERFPNLPPVEMHLYKHIPDGAGLGGGSSDATTTLLMLNEMFALGLGGDDLRQMAATLGADCPYFVDNVPVRAGGIGNEFSPVDLDLSGYILLVVKPPVSVSTAEAYSRVSAATPDVDVATIVSWPLPLWDGALINDFEPCVFALHPELCAIKTQLLQSGAAYAAMSGSGSAMFGIFNSDKMAENAATQFVGSDTFVVPL